VAVTDSCIFCKLASGELPSHFVYQDDDSYAFLDNQPLFPGHVLLMPRGHYETLGDLPAHLVGPLFTTAQLIAKAVESALDAEGTFVAINNRVSQTVPHLHIHIVPRRRRDGLKGFFWPRHDYQDDSARETVRDAIEREIQKLLIAG
jgi:histidine triad (HIT) family protein